MSNLNYMSTLHSVCNLARNSEQVCETGFSKFISDTKSHKVRWAAEVNDESSPQDKWVRKVLEQEIAMQDTNADVAATRGPSRIKALC